MRTADLPVGVGGPAAGVGFCLAAFCIWGLAPVYWKALQAVPPLEILAHRIVWSFVFLAAAMTVLGRWGGFAEAFSTRRSFLPLLCSTGIIWGNWLLFIWAINTDRVLQASLGYYINPLVNVFLGMVVLRERLRVLQGLSVLLAGAAVAWLTLGAGEFPWPALALAVSFAFYGLIRKTAPTGALVGLAVETALLSVPAIGYLLFTEARGTGAFLHAGSSTSLLLAGAGVLTAAPLVLFTMGARRVRLATVGFLQYISPTVHFLLAVLVYGEPLTGARLAAFLLIWMALGLYSTDSVLFLGGRGSSRPRPLVV